MVPLGDQSEYADHRAESDPEPDVSPLGRRTLRPGARGERVQSLQRRLDELGYDPGPQDSIYGPLTFAAVRELQRHLGRRADGVADGRVLAALADPRLAHMQDRLIVAEPHASVRPAAAARLVGRYGPRWRAVAWTTKGALSVPGGRGGTDDGAREPTDELDGFENAPDRPAAMEGWHVVHTRGAAGPGHYEPELLQRLLHRSAGRDALVKEGLRPFQSTVDGDGPTQEIGSGRVPERVYMDLGTIGWGDGGTLLKLLRRLRRELARRDAQLVVSVPLFIGESAPRWFKAVDVGTLAETAHTVVLVPPVFITGKPSRKDGRPVPPRPPSPGEISAAVRDVVTEVPSWRCLLLLSLGSLLLDVDDSDPDHMAGPTLLSYRQTLALAYSHRTRPRWDDRVGRPVFYGVGSPRRSVVWLENRDSVRAKLAIVQRRRLGGVYLFAVGMEDPRIWPLFPRRGHVSPSGAI